MVQQELFSQMNMDNTKVDLSRVDDPGTESLESRLGFRENIPATLMGLPREIRYNILDFYLRSGPDIKNHYPRNQGNGPRVFSRECDHAPLLVSKEFHTNHIVEAEKAVMHVLKLNRVYNSTAGTWNLDRICRPIPPPSNARRITIVTRLSHYNRFFKQNRIDHSFVPTFKVQKFQKEVINPLETFLSRFKKITEIKIKWTTDAQFENHKWTPAYENMAKKFEEMLKGCGEVREILVHRDWEDTMATRSEGGLMRNTLVKRGDRWVTRKNLNEMKIVLRMMRERKVKDEQAKMDKKRMLQGSELTALAAQHIT
jgi:hypothetical protein